MRLVFMGTPAFAVPSLKALVQKHEVLAVVTQPDKPRGRGKKLSFPPVKEAAVRYDIPCWQPESLKDQRFRQLLQGVNPEICIVVAFGRILPMEVLQLPRWGCINLHASLLPKYRGAAPLHRAIMNGEKKTGVTIMQMNAGLDTGDILLARAAGIGEETTVGELHDKLAEIGAGLLLETLERIPDKVERRAQNNALASYAPPITKIDEKIAWRQTTEEVLNRIRGLNPWPGAFSGLEGKRLKIWQAKPYKLKGNPGEVLAVFEDAFVVGTGDGAVIILELQPEGRKKMTAGAFLRGKSLKAGTVLE